MKTDPKYASEKAKSITEALTAFKYWSNYLLITTVAAVGWVGSKDSPKGMLSVISIGFLCFSAIFGIFTLALIPIIREQIPDHIKEKERQGKLENASFYNIRPKFRFTIRRSKPPRDYVYVKTVCWVQHILFILGVVFYTLAAIISWKIKYPIFD